MMASASGLPPFLCVATTGAGEVEPKISSTSCERGAGAHQYRSRRRPAAAATQFGPRSGPGAQLRAGGWAGRKRAGQGWQWGTTLSLTTCCVLMAYGGSSGLSFFEGGGCGQACGGQDGAGRQRAAEWDKNSVGQQRAASAQQLTITFISFRRVPSIAPGPIQFFTQRKLPKIGSWRRKFQVSGLCRILGKQCSSTDLLPHG